MNNPEFVKIKDKKYKINTDYRVALRCDEVSKDKSIGDYERSLAIIYLLFGDEGLNDSKNYDGLLKLAVKYLSCDEEIEDDNEEPDMDFQQDLNLIQISIKQEFNGLDIFSLDYLHWWDFYKYINGLTENCVLNRTRELRSYDISSIKDDKERAKIEKAQKRVSLKNKKVTLNDKQKNSADTFYELTGIERR